MDLEISTFFFFSFFERFSKLNFAAARQKSKKASFSGKFNCNFINRNSSIYTREASTIQIQTFKLNLISNKTYPYYPYQSY